MPILDNHPSKSLMMLTTASALLMPYGVLRAAGAATPDACRWLTAAETTPFIGAPSTPAFRATDQGQPSATGSSCVYRGSGGRQIIVTSTGDGGRQTDDILASVRSTMAGGLQKSGNPDLASTTNRVLVRGPSGPWDTVNWIPGGTLFVTKGDQGFNIDMGGASGREDEALAIARQIAPRLTHPLAYDGARAAGAAPQSASHRARACAVVPAAAVAAAIGQLDGAPQEEANGAKCVYRVESAQGPRSYPIEFVWEGGLKNYNMLAHGMDTLGSTMGGAIPTDAMNSMPTDAHTSAMIGGLMKMVGGGGNAAPGAAAEVGFKTENNLPGPWDNATLQHGTQLMAVKGDVMVAMDLKSAEYDKAKALLAAAASRM